jgi:glucosyltransferase
MHNPSVLVYVPCRNYEHYLDDALQSIAWQTYANLEIRVGHDNCGTGLAPVGLSANRNKILNDPSVTHDYVIFLDADDKLPFDYVESLVRTARPGRCVVCCPAELWEEETGYIIPKLPVTPKTLLTGNTIHCAALIPVRLLREVGGYDESLSAWEDWDLWMHFASLGVEFRCCSTTRLLYRRHTGSMNKTFSSTVDDMREKLRAKYAVQGQTK